MKPPHELEHRGVLFLLNLPMLGTVLKLKSLAENSIVYGPWAISRGGGSQNTTVLYPIYYADDDMFRPLWAIFRSQKCI